MAAAAVFAPILAACSSSAPSASALAVVSGNGQSATVATTVGAPLVVVVTDQNGAALSGVQVSFTTTGGATVGTALVTTDASGHASTTLTLGTTIGTDSVYAWVTSVNAPAIFTAAATAGPATQLVIVGGNNQVSRAGTTLINALIVEVEDQYGNPVSGRTVDWMTTGGVLTPAQPSTSGPGGTVSATFQVPGAPMVVTVTATLHGTSLAAVFTETAD